MPERPHELPSPQERPLRTVFARFMRASLELHRAEAGRVTPGHRVRGMQVLASLPQTRSREAEGVNANAKAVKREDDLFGLGSLLPPADASKAHDRFAREIDARTLVPIRMSEVFFRLEALQDRHPRYVRFQI